MWTAEHRRAADRRGLRYPSDLTDAEWAFVAPFVPPGRQGGRKREVDVREVVNAIFYVLSMGCQWNALPKDLPPKSTAYDDFILLDREGALQRMHDALYVMAREQAGREARPTAAIIDSQSAKAAQKGALNWTRKVTTLARVRLEGAHHLWRKVPSGELSIDPEADERRGRATGLVEAS